MRACLFIAIIFVVSCSNSESNNGLTTCDSVIINFNTPQTNYIEKTVTSTEKIAIKKLARFMDSKTTEAYNCSYDGNLMFYKQGKLAGDVSFNYSVDSCRHFIMTVEGKLISTTMTSEAASFLKSLAGGKDWY